MTQTPENQQQYGSILTILGENAEQNGKLQNKQITFTHMAIGDANDEYVQPDRKQTALVNELARIPVNSVDVLQPTPDSVPMLKVEAILPDDVNDLVIREFAAVATFDGNTYLHAVGNNARIYVPPPVNNGNVSTPVTLEMIFVITSAEPIVEIDPNVVTASRDWVKNEELVQTDMLSGNGGLINNPVPGDVFSGNERIQINDFYSKSKKLWFPWDKPQGSFLSFIDNDDYGTACLTTTEGEFEFVTENVKKYRKDKDIRGWGASKDEDVSYAVEKALNHTQTIKFKDQDYVWIKEIQTYGTINLLGVNSQIKYQPDIPGVSKIIHGESVNTNGLVIDGGHKADRAIVAEKSLVCLDTKFNNFWNDSSVRVLHVNDADYLYLYRTEFNNIGALGTGVPGSGGGAVRCVWINGGNNLQGTIIDCKFNHVVNRLQDGTLQRVEDADAIVLQASATGFNVANLRIMNSKFANCQKRCVKSQMSEATTVDMINNIIVDTIGAPSSESNPEHALMLAVVSVYGGSLYYENNRFIKGYCSREIDVAEYPNTNGIKTPIRDIEINSGRFLNEFSAYSGESQTRSLLINTTKETSPDCHVTISGGKRNAGSLPGKIVADTIVLNKGILKDLSYELEAHTAIDIDGTIVKGSNKNAGMIINKSPVTTVTKLITSSVTFGIYYGPANNDLEDFSATHTGCVFGTNQNGDIGIDSLKTEHKSRVTNISAVTKRANFDRVVSATTTLATAGSAMDIPLKPAFYKREFVNGVEYRTPYFNVEN